MPPVKPRPFVGWISPEGERHELGWGAPTHAVWAAEHEASPARLENADEADADAYSGAFNDLLHRGWVRIGGTGVAEAKSLGNFGTKRALRHYFNDVPDEAPATVHIHDNPRFSPSTAAEAKQRFRFGRFAGALMRLRKGGGPMRYSHAAFATVIDQNRHDTSTPLIYADWLDDNELPGMARVVRDHIENHRTMDPTGSRYAVTASNPAEWTGAAVPTDFPAGEPSVYVPSLIGGWRPKRAGANRVSLGVIHRAPGPQAPPGTDFVDALEAGLKTPRGFYATYAPHEALEVLRGMPGVRGAERAAEQIQRAYPEVTRMARRPMRYAAPNDLSMDFDALDPDDSIPGGPPEFRREPREGPQHAREWDRIKDRVRRHQIAEAVKRGANANAAPRPHPNAVPPRTTVTAADLRSARVARELKGTRLAYHLHQIRRAFADDAGIRGAVDAALSGKGIYRGGTDAFAEIGRRLARHAAGGAGGLLAGVAVPGGGTGATPDRRVLAHRFLKGYNWHRAANALELDSYMKDLVDANLKPGTQVDPRKYLKVLTLYGLGHMGKPHAYGLDRSYGRFWHAARTVAGRLAGANGIGVPPAQLTDQMIQRSLARLAYREGERASLARLASRKPVEGAPTPAPTPGWTEDPASQHRAKQPWRTAFDVLPGEQTGPHFVSDYTGGDRKHFLVTGGAEGHAQKFRRRAAILRYSRESGHQAFHEVINGSGDITPRRIYADYLDDQPEEAEPGVPEFLRSHTGPMQIGRAADGRVRIESFTKKIHLGTGDRRNPIYVTVDYRHGPKDPAAYQHGPRDPEHGEISFTYSSRGSGGCFGSHVGAVKPGPGLTLGMVSRLKKLGDRWHLNARRAGTPKQEEFLRANPITAVYPQSRYDLATRALEAAGLSPDPETGYRYGHGRQYEPVPHEVLTEIAKYPEPTRRFSRRGRSPVRLDRFHARPTASERN